MRVKTLILFRTVGGLNEYKKIFNYGYNCDSIELFSGNYWIIFVKVFLGIKNKYLKLISRNFDSIDVIHIVDNPLFAYPILKYLLKISNVKIIYTIHDPKPHVESKLSRKFIRLLTLFSQKATNKLSSENPQRLYIHIHSEKLITNYLRKNKNLLIEPHPTSLINSDVEDVFDISDKFTISFVGRVEYYKGIDVLLEAILELDKSVSNSLNIQFIIAGRGNYKVSIPDTKNIRVIRLDRYCSDDELDSLIKFSKLIVLPYREATSSGVLTRVIAHNTPVIVSEKGCLPDYVESGVNGFVFNKKSELHKIIFNSINYKFKPLESNFDAKTISLNLFNKIYKNESS